MFHDVTRLLRTSMQPRPRPPRDLQANPPTTALLLEGYRAVGTQVVNYSAIHYSSMNRAIAQNNSNSLLDRAASALNFALGEHAASRAAALNLVADEYAAPLRARGQLPDRI